MRAEAINGFILTSILITLYIYVYLSAIIKLKEQNFHRDIIALFIASQTLQLVAGILELHDRQHVAQILLAIGALFSGAALVVINSFQIAVSTSVSNYRRAVIL